MHPRACTVRGRWYRNDRNGVPAVPSGGHLSRVPRARDARATTPAREARSARREVRDRGQDDVRQGLERGAIADTGQDGDRAGDARRATHAQVRGRVADHRGSPGRHAEPFAQPEHRVGRGLVRECRRRRRRGPRTRRRSRAPRACARSGRGRRSSRPRTVRRAGGAARAAPGGPSRGGRARRDRGRATRARPPPRLARDRRPPRRRTPRRPRGCGTSASRRGGRGRGRGPSSRSTPRSAYRPSRSASPVAASSRLASRVHPPAPHQVELDERAVLVEDQQVDSVEQPIAGGHGAHASAISSSTDSTGAFASRTSGPSCGKLIVTVSLELRAA